MPGANPRQLPMYAGESGLPIDWTQVAQAVGWADVVLVGEQHDDAMGHAFELAIAQDAVAGCPRSVISLEMLERDEQLLVDDYFDGIIDAPTFIKLTDSKDWAGEGSWEKWYQPLIDAAKDGGGFVLAANAPRRYVRLARTEGYKALEHIGGPRRAFFDIPTTPVSDAYRQRFFDVMTHSDEPLTKPAATSPSSEPATMPAASHGHGTSTSGDLIAAAFRSQLIWDTTMAASIARSRQFGSPKVVHFVGQFHVDFQGGTYQQLRKRLPGARILTISMQRDDGSQFRTEDRGRADIVIYTGARPPSTAETTAATQPTTSPATAPATRSDPPSASPPNQ